MPRAVNGGENQLMGLIQPERIARFEITRPSAESIEAYKGLADLTSTVADVLDALGIVGTIPCSLLRPLSAGQRAVGPAITLRYVPDRVSPGFGHARAAKAQLSAHLEAYSIARPGDVLVVAAGGVDATSSLGGLSTDLALRAGLAGTVVDGAIRDVAHIRQVGYAVWARGITPQTGKFRFEVAEINGMVGCAGVQVNPGDLVCADEDGVVVIPSDRVEEVLNLAAAAAEKEQALSAAIAHGMSATELRRILAPDKW